MYNNQLKREKRKGEDEESERKRRKEERLLELEKNPSPEVRKYGSTQKCDDDEGHLIIKPGDYITHEYKVMGQIGEGTFGRVVECWQRSTTQRVAIKVIRNVPRYREAAKIEITIVEFLMKYDKAQEWHCIRLLDRFDFRNHVCMVFPLYGLSIYDFLRTNKFRPFRPDDVRVFALQLTRATRFMHKLRLIHTDLKPENILLEQSNYRYDDSDGRHTRIPLLKTLKVIDFGSATFEYAYHTSIVSTRHYRAPEVILGQDWSYPCDIWSIGCILVELVTGRPIFNTHENLEHLHMMEKYLGPIPLEFKKKSNPVLTKYFDDKWNLKPVTSKSGQSRIDAIVPLKNMKYDPLFVDVVSKMLCFCPSERLTGKQILHHDYFGCVVANSMDELLIGLQQKEIEEVGPIPKEFLMKKTESQ
eukprot:TRINITY_DN25616_c0_g1_i1.p1 TRINITY_DN25616_c0_g1~~TRINITY_DN25616_c0_g1_i1.p1  ORF type:complete len:416 (-),score=57.04 TRINITY_DN25616_c0_g1_i1:67-1314(-)